MRFHWFLSFAVVLIFSMLGTSLNAQNGAVITHGDFYLGYVFINEEDQIVSWHSVNWNPCVGQPDLHPVADTWIELPNNGALLRHINGPLFTKVFWPATEADILAAGNMCNFMAVGPLVAEGLAQYRLVDNDWDVSLTRTNSAGEKIVGPLYDLAGLCGDAGVVGFNWGRRIRIDKNGEFHVVNFRGPKLSCHGE